MLPKIDTIDRIVHMATDQYMELYNWMKRNQQNWISMSLDPLTWNLYHLTDFLKISFLRVPLERPACFGSCVLFIQIVYSLHLTFWSFNTLPKYPLNCAHKFSFKLELNTLFCQISNSVFSPNSAQLITARKRSCGKVMFSQVSACPQGGIGT